MKKVRKLRECARCPDCHELFVLRSISATKVPKHRDRLDPSSLCSGSGAPIQQIEKRYV